MLYIKLFIEREKNIGQSAPECPFNDVRNKHFVAFSSKDLFENVEAQNIIDFIKETRFYKQL